MTSRYARPERNDLNRPVSAARGLAVQLGPDARLIIEEGEDHFYVERDRTVGEAAATYLSRFLLKKQYTFPFF